MRFKAGEGRGQMDKGETDLVGRQADTGSDLLFLTVLLSRTCNGKWSLTLDEVNELGNNSN